MFNFCDLQILSRRTLVTSGTSVEERVPKTKARSPRPVRSEIKFDLMATASDRVDLVSAEDGARVAGNISRNFAKNVGCPRRLKQRERERLTLS